MGIIGEGGIKLVSTTGFGVWVWVALGTVGFVESF